MISGIIYDSVAVFYQGILFLMTSLLFSHHYKRDGPSRLTEQTSIVHLGIGLIILFYYLQHSLQDECGFDCLLSSFISNCLLPLS